MKRVCERKRKKASNKGRETKKDRRKNPMLLPICSDVKLPAGDESLIKMTCKEPISARVAA